MKTLLFISNLFFSLYLQATELSGVIKTESFEEAKKHQQQLKFIVESTKVGLFSSDVDVYVKEFQYKADFDKENLIIRDIEVVFKTSSMDTESEGRDEKLHNLCLSQDQFPTITIQIAGPLFLKDARPQTVSGIAMIRGKEKNFTIELFKKIDNDHFYLTGKTIWSLKEMEIPDPSIAVAKLSDDIRIEIKFDSQI